MQGSRYGAGLGVVHVDDRVDDDVFLIWNDVTADFESKIYEAFGQDRPGPVGIFF